MWEWKEQQGGDSKGNAQGLQANFPLGSRARFGWGGRGQVWESEVTVLQLPDLGQPSLEGKSKSPKSLL